MFVSFPPMFMPLVAMNMANSANMAASITSTFLFPVSLFPIGAGTISEADGSK